MESMKGGTRTNAMSLCLFMFILFYFLYCQDQKALQGGVEMIGDSFFEVSGTENGSDGGWRVVSVNYFFIPLVQK